MNYFSTGHDVVDQVGSVHFEGNVLPTNWFNSFRLENGKPDVNAVILLSEIVYWHRPTVVRDENTGQITSIKKKFKADLLQRSYQSFSDQFGFSKQQVKEALDRLEQFGVIKRHFRTVESNGQKYNNILFIELITPVLFKVTTLSASKLGGSDFSNGEAPHFKRGTNTENTTEITTDINLGEKTPKTSKFSAKKFLIENGVSEQTAQEFIDLKNKKHKTITERSLKIIFNQASVAQLTNERVFQIIVLRGWESFKASWNWSDTNADLDQLENPNEQQLHEQQKKSGINLPEKPKGFLGARHA